MLQVSDAYKELVKSNVRPKAEPIIKVSGKDNNGNDIELVWRAKDIKDLKYKRGIDPVGRELPYMELTWTEIYTGKLNAESYPEKYNNVAQYIAVELSFVQDLSFYQTWKSLYKSGKTWKDIFSLATTWKKLKTEVTQEAFTTPIMFLTAKPTIKGQTITWTARDLFYFISDKQTRKFSGSPEGNPITLANALSFFILNARSGYLESLDVFNGLTATATKLLQGDANERIDKEIICDGNTLDILLNLSTVYSRYWDYKDNIAVLKRFEPYNSGFVYDSNVLYDYPVVQKVPDISNYAFKHYTISKNEQQKYELEPDHITNYGEVAWYRFILKGYGEAYSEFDSNALNPQFLTVADLVSKYSETKTVSVVPISYTAQENSVVIATNGEVFVEDNPSNPYNLEEEILIKRKNFLVEYFNGDKHSLTFDALPNFAIEAGDVISVETNLYENDDNLFKNAIVVSNEITYNGTMKQKIIAHEVGI